MNLQASFARYVYWPLAQKLKGEHAARALKDLSQSQWKSQEELLSSQWQLVRETINKAVREVPYYRRVCADTGWDMNNKKFSYEDFLGFPKLDKETLQNNIKEFLNPHYAGRVTTGRTSGSTGLSLTLYYTSEHESYSEAGRWRAKNWWGVKPGSPQVAIWGRPYTGYKDRIAQQVKSYLMNSLMFSAFDLREEALVRIWKKISRFKPSVIYGYPSAIYTLAVYLKENRIVADKLGIKVVIITAESSTSIQRDLIEEVFGCKTANEYGCSETGGFVYECPEGSWHISSELTFMEFLDNNGSPVSSDEIGELYVTHLRNDYMPLIRYRLGDIGGPLQGLCACGRCLPLMNISVAKERDFIVLSNGERHTSEILVYITRAVLEKYPDAILHFRALQKNAESLEVEIVPGSGDMDEALRYFRRLLSKQTKGLIDIHIRTVQKLEREPTGKLRYFVSEVNQEPLAANLSRKIEA